LFSSITVRDISKYRYTSLKEQAIDAQLRSSVPPWFWARLCKLQELYPELFSEALEQLWNANPNLRRLVVIDAYLEGLLNLSKAAELLGVSRWHLQQEFLEKGIPLHIGVETLEAAKAEVEAWARWQDPPQQE